MGRWKHGTAGVYHQESRLVGSGAGISSCWPRIRHLERERLERVVILDLPCTLAGCGAVSMRCAAHVPVDSWFGLVVTGDPSGRGVVPYPPSLEREHTCRCRCSAVHAAVACKRLGRVYERVLI